MKNRTTESLVAKPRLVTNREELGEALRQFRREGRRIGLVPTMGALHAGHLSLVRASRVDCDRTIVTIFVNPAQFGPHEDLTRYPRTLARDLELLAEEQVDLVFCPPDDDMYPAGFSTYVEPPAVAAAWEGQCRPGHFRGVATVVMKLFHMIPADAAYFGQKDYQQAQVIRRMVTDLNVPIAVHVCPIIREPDGLAMSSRNRYLSPVERQQAVALSRALSSAEQQVRGGERRAAVIQECMRRVLREAGIERIDYVAAADPDTLSDWTGDTARVVLLIAAFVGSTRLIDNCLIE